MYIHPVGFSGITIYQPLTDICIKTLQIHDDLRHVFIYIRIRHIDGTHPTMGRDQCQKQLTCSFVHRLVLPGY